MTSYSAFLRRSEKGIEENNMDKIQNIIVGIHGIRTLPKYNWTRIFAIHLGYDKRFNDWLIKRASYGFLRAFLVVIPLVRKIKVWWFKRFLRKLQKKYPDAKINILAHSFGTYISYEAVRRAGKDGRNPIKINKLILVASIVSAHEDFKDTVGKGLIRKVYNYCSYDDKVARLNPFGHSGYWGFLAPGKRDHIEIPWPYVQNCRFNVKHSQWFDDEPPDFYKKWLDNLNSGGAV